MLRTTDPLAFRTLKPLYEHRQGTPFGPVYLNESFQMSAANIYPGMVAAGPIDDNPRRVKVATAAGDKFFGLFAHNCNAQIDELNKGKLQTAVWKGTSSCWRIYAPAYNTSETYAVPSNGAEVTLTWDNAGRLCPVGSASAVGTQACAKLIGVGTNYIEVQLIVP